MGARRRTPEGIDTRTPAQRKADFLRELGDDGIIGLAAERANVGRTTVYEWQKDPVDGKAFQLEVNRAIERSTDLLELAAIQRAREGVVRKRFYKDQEIATERHYSDGLTTFLLKGRRRELYGDKTEVEINAKTLKIELGDDEPEEKAE